VSGPGDTAPYSSMVSLPRNRLQATATTSGRFSCYATICGGHRLHLSKPISHTRRTQRDTGLLSSQEVRRRVEPEGFGFGEIGSCLVPRQVRLLQAVDQPVVIVGRTEGSPGTIQMIVTPCCAAPSQIDSSVYAGLRVGLSKPSSMPRSPRVLSLRW